MPSDLVRIAAIIVWYAILTSLTKPQPKEVSSAEKYRQMSLAYWKLSAMTALAVVIVFRQGMSGLNWWLVVGALCLLQHFAALWLSPLRHRLTFRAVIEDILIHFVVWPVGAVYQLHMAVFWRREAIKRKAERA